MEELVSTHNLYADKKKKYIREKACDAKDRVYLGPMQDGPTKVLRGATSTPSSPRTFPILLIHPSRFPHPSYRAMVHLFSELKFVEITLLGLITASEVLSVLELETQSR